MATHILFHPDRCFGGDGVSGNLSMKGIGRDKATCCNWVYTLLQSFSCCEDIHTNMSYSPWWLTYHMCVDNPRSSEESSHWDRHWYIKYSRRNSSGGWHLFLQEFWWREILSWSPRVYIFRGKTIPVLVRWNESATIASKILVEMSVTLHVLNAMSRNSKNIKPFQQINGHKSPLSLPFLEYINTPKDHLVVCLEVPRSMDLLQIGAITRL